jgi:hypothetical protein
MNDIDSIVEEYSAAPKPLSLQDKMTDVPATTFDEVCAAFLDFLHLDSIEPIRVLLAAYVSNRFKDADPVWIFLIAPPSSAKTEFIMALEKVPGTYCFSELTPRTLISGIKGASLLHRVGNHSILLQKDFTTILNMRPDDRSAILAQFREVFDGKFGREMGKGKMENWEGKMGFISGCTPEIEKTLMVNAKFGDRFLYYRMPKTDHRAAMRKTMSNASRPGMELRANIQRATAGFLNSLTVPASPPPVPERLFEALSSICLLSVLLRTPVDREVYSATKDIQSVGEPEGPMRMMKELITFAGALIFLRGGEWDDADYGILSKLVFDSVTSRRLRPVEALYAADTPLTTKDLELAMQLPARTIKSVCEELAAAGLISKLLVSRGDGEFSGEGHDKTYSWELSGEVRELMSYRYSVSGEKHSVKVSLPFAVSVESAAVPVTADEIEF